MKTTLEWLEAVKPVLAESEQTPEQHGPSLRALLVEAEQFVREYQHMKEQMARDEAIRWRRQRQMAKEATRRKYGNG